HPAEAVQPGERPLDQPPPPIPPHPPAVVPARLLAVLAVRGRQPIPVGRQVVPERVRVVPPVGHHRDVGRDRDGRPDAGQGGGPGGHLGHVGRVRRPPERDTGPVPPQLALHPLTALGAADARPPCRASATVASRNSSDVSSPPAAASSAGTTFHTRPHTPA